MSNHTPPNPTSKVCTKCGITKPLNEYHKDKSRKEGISYYCKKCRCEQVRNHYRENTDRYKEYANKNREDIKEYKRQWHQNNREDQLEQQRRYRQENREALSELVRQWQKKNREKTRASCRNRRALKRNSKGTHTISDIRALYEGQNGKCWYCGVDVGNDYHVDHFIPLSKGGSNDVGNLRIACPTCNLSKNAKDPHEWSGRLL